MPKPSTRHHRWPEAVFGKLPGVLRTEVGYTGGGNKNPTYGSVCAGDGHTEALKVEYDPATITYANLLEVFWSLHDPSWETTAQYKSAVWPQTPEQAAVAASVIAGKEAKSVLPILTEVEEAPRQFYKAEWYHQNYKVKNRARWALFAAFVALGYLPAGSVPYQPLLARALGVVLFVSFLPQLLSLLQRDLLWVIYGCYVGERALRAQRT
eukprot:1191287-Prorocentrum_minimum.AAC.2